ncbi:YcnI family protein [Staphylococcus canis]|uniref:YcnI family protein n=1 Tax=Staphylococcus canis TaxID=2724942 RepID=A0ABS0T6W6_9STAP|nr:YcnI family protein [Staphylococcus canis]MBI5974315.1 YcnI family protein [Staphylococcus canis]
MFMLTSLTYTAQAHVTLNPDTSEPGSYEEYQVRVPVEKDSHTTKLELEVPEGVTVSNVQPVEGFKHDFTKDKKGNITKITWKATGKGIGKNEYMNFPIIAANPEEEGTFKWKAIQTYKNGDVVKWTSDDENSETPAPTTTVKQGEDMSKTEEADQSTGTSKALWVITIASLIIALIALFKRRNFTK